MPPSPEPSSGASTSPTDVVARLLKTHGLSKAGLAKRAGMKEETLKGALEGRVRSHKATRQRIAAVLGVDVHDIWSATREVGGLMDFDETTVGFHAIKRWDRLDRLERQDVRPPEVETGNWAQTWVDEAALVATTQAERAKGGAVCPTLRGWSITEPSNGRRGEFRLRIARSHYWNYAAIRHLLRQPEQRARRDRLNAQAQQSPEALAAVVAGSPPGNVVINVTVTVTEPDKTGTPKDWLLLLRRSTAVRTWRGYTGVGPHETMIWPDESATRRPGQPPLAPEDCFQLAERALAEECHLWHQRGDYDLSQVIVSWFGYYLNEGSGYFFAHVRTHLSKEALAARIEEAESGFEHDDIDWLELTQTRLDAVLETWRRDPEGGRTSEMEDPFLMTAPVALAERWRIRNLLP